MKKVVLILVLFPLLATAQLKWNNADSLFQPLPEGVHVFFTNDSLDGKPNKAYYISAPLQSKQIEFAAQTGNGKRYTPSQYYLNESAPLVVVNTTFFEFVHNSNLNLVINNGLQQAFNQHSIAGKGQDTLTYRHALGRAIGINKKRRADIAWVYTDTAAAYALASQLPVSYFKDSIPTLKPSQFSVPLSLKKWKMQTAVGGGPVLVQNGVVKITNNEEMKFSGKALMDKHPRTAMGYTNDGQLIILAVEGRFPGKAEGANLKQLAEIFVALGCQEALNLDGGGSSCLLINGKQTITPSDKEGQRPVPAVFMIRSRKN